jgi:tRNA(Ile)-lysidine synthase
VVAKQVAALQIAVLEFIKNQQLIRPGETVVIGLSGGPDSLCLAHLLLSIRQDYPFRMIAAHLNHQLRGPAAAADADFVADYCGQQGLECKIESRPVEKLAREHHLSIEEAARIARYQFLGAVAKENEAHKIAVAHHRDDLVESVLMHFLRGSGLSGLRGILPSTPLGELRLEFAANEIIGAKPDDNYVDIDLIRPLLATPREAILDYCREMALEPRFDRSNLDMTYFRNRIRGELLPLLESYNPQIRPVIYHLAQVAAGDVDVLQQAAALAWDEVVIPGDESEILFDLEKWRALPLGLRRSLLREAVHRLQRELRDIDFVHIEQAMRVAMERPTGSRAVLPHGMELCVSYDRLLIYRRQPSLPDTLLLLRQSAAYPVPFPGESRLENDWFIRAELLDHDEWLDEKIRDASPWEIYLDAEALSGELRLRRRREGDRLKPLGMGGQSKRINELMINEKIPAAWRPYYPLLEDEKRILWLCGVCLAEDTRVRPETKRILHLSIQQAAERVDDELPR